MVFTEFLFGYFPVSVCKSLIFMENIREIDLVSHFMSFKVIVQPIIITYCTIFSILAHCGVIKMCPLNIFQKYDNGK